MIEVDGFKIPDDHNMCPVCQDAFIPKPWELKCLGDGEHDWYMPEIYNEAYGEANNER